MGWIEYNEEEYIIDFGWKPDFDIDGGFIVYLIRDNNWEKLILDLRSEDISTFIKDLRSSFNKLKEISPQFFQD